MTASFIDRVCANGDYATDGGNIDMMLAWSIVDGLHSGTQTPAQIKTQYSMTTQQGNELDEIFATRPDPIEIDLPLLDPIFVAGPSYAQWPSKVKSALMQGLLKFEGGGFEDSEQVRTKLGLSN